jgi:hypothetical protein
MVHIDYFVPSSVAAGVTIYLDLISGGTQRNFKELFQLYLIQLQMTTTIDKVVVSSIKSRYSICLFLLLKDLTLRFFQLKLGAIQISVQNKVYFDNIFFKDHFRRRTTLSNIAMCPNQFQTNNN